MSLAPGARLGAYEIVAMIGAGGMGEVYRARDTKLNRSVALKVLPESVCRDPARVARFENEARFVGALNHQNIAHLYGVDDSTGTPALAMELVEGPTLAEIIEGSGKGLPTDRALNIARQLADALDAAHEFGIVHRDLKPANIKVRADGTVKVLDFGVAKAMTASEADRQIWSSATRDVTAAGTLVGTVAYMSPEQARGAAVDKRTDIWAFGCVLYDMLAGRHAFSGATSSDTLAAILQREPDWSALPASTPPAIVRLVQRCLEKDPKKRLRDIAEARFQLDEDAVSAPRPTARAHQRDARSTWFVAVALLAAAAGAAGGWLIHARSGNTPVAAVRATMSAPPGTTLATAQSAISPDGRSIVFVAQSASTQALWIRDLAGETAKELAGTNGAALPFWSPDSRQIAFFSAGKLQRIDVSGGQPFTICAVPGGRGGSWSTDGTIIFNLVNDGPLWRVPAAGGAPAAVTTVDRAANEDSHRFPWFLPDGKHFLYFVRSWDQSARGIYVGSLDDARVKVRVTLADEAGVFAPGASGGGGHLLWLRDTTLVAQPFDPGTFTLSGEATPIARDISPLGLVIGQAAATAAANGTLLYGTPPDQNVQITWFDHDGKVTGTLGSPDLYAEVAISPDGQRIVAGRSAARVYDSAEAWVFDVARGIPNRATFHGINVNSGIAWSHDGRRLAYVTPGAPPNIAITDLTSGNERKFPSPNSQGSPSWSPDDRFVLFGDTANTPGAATSGDLMLLPADADGSSAATPYLQTPFPKRNAQFSPDGKWVAYTTVEAGEEDIYVLSYPSGAFKQRVSSGGGDFPRWSRDGRELLYLARGGMLTAVAVRPGAGALALGASQPLFRIPLPVGAAVHPYDVAPDGRILALVAATANIEPSMTLVLNWRALAPSR